MADEYIYLEENTLEGRPQARRASRGLFYSGNFYLFGGCCLDRNNRIVNLNDLWCWDLAETRWIKIADDDSQTGKPAARPSPRRYHSFTELADELYVFGGCSSNSEGKPVFLNDLWKFNKSEQCWEEIKSRNTPPERYCHNAGVIDGRLVIFGGYANWTYLNDIWTYDLKNNVWECKNTCKSDNKNGRCIPKPRYGAQGAVVGHKLYIFGGYGNKEELKDMWEWSDKDGWEEIKFSNTAVIPEARYCAVFERYQNNIILFGGRNRIDYCRNFNDLWIYNSESKKWDCLLENDMCLNGKQDKENSLSFRAKCASGILNNDLFLFGGEKIYCKGDKKLVHSSEFYKFIIDKKKWELVS